MVSKGKNTWTAEVEADGEFVRRQTNFREQVRRDGSTPYQPAAGRYHLACPWAHRTLIMRKLKGL
jgi:glutathionyl-hydroquinone reductase